MAKFMPFELMALAMLRIRSTCRPGWSFSGNPAWAAEMLGLPTQPTALDKHKTLRRCVLCSTASVAFEGIREYPIQLYTDCGISYLKLIFLYVSQNQEVWGSYLITYIRILGETMRASVIQALENAKNTKAFATTSRSLIKINGSVINVRTATQKAGSKYWFDVTPSFYTKVQLFLFACGSAYTVYVFPSTILQQQLKNASLGGEKQVPNFTIFSDKHELEPAGAAGARSSIRQYLNAYSLIP